MAPEVHCRVINLVPICMLLCGLAGGLAGGRLYAAVWKTEWCACMLLCGLGGGLNGGLNRGLNGGPTDRLCTGRLAGSVWSTSRLWPASQTVPMQRLTPEKSIINQMGLNFFILDLRRVCTQHLRCLGAKHISNRDC